MNLQDLHWYQYGTGGCCKKDSENQCFSCVLCECQFDCMFPCVFLGAVLSGVLCCPAGTLRNLKIPATKEGLDATWQAAQQTPGVANGGNVKLFGCCSEPANTCFTMHFCPCISLPCYYADNAALIDGLDDVTSWSIDFASCVLFGLCGLAWCVTSTKRVEMRYALGMKEDLGGPCGPPCGDSCAHMWCMPCALIEERKALLAKGCTREVPAIKIYAEIVGGQQPTAWASCKPRAQPR